MSSSPKQEIDTGSPDIRYLSELMAFALLPGDHFEAKLELAEHFLGLAGGDDDLWTGAAVALLGPLAEKGHPHANYRLGEIAMNDPNGAGVGKGFEYFKRASQAGHAESTFHVARCYLTGENVEQNLSEAARLFTLAKERGCDDDIEDYDELLVDDLTPEQLRVAPTRS